MGVIVKTQEFAKQGFPTNGAVQSNFGLGTYTASANAGSYQIGFKTSGAASTWFNRACFTRYDTSVIGAGATVTSVRMRWRITSTSGSPNNWAFYAIVGTWIGSTLTASAGDFNPSGPSQTTIFDYISEPPNGIYEKPMHANTVNVINKTGQTDVRWQDGSAFTFGQDFLSTFSHTAVYPRLIVTWEINVDDPIGIPHAGL